MRRLAYILMMVLLLAGCGKKVKVTDPAQRAALRTRNTEIPVDSVLTASGRKAILDVFSRMDSKQLKEDWSQARESATAEKASDKFKEACQYIKEHHSPSYSPALTIYFRLMLIAFAVYVAVRLGRALILKK